MRTSQQFMESTTMRSVFVGVALSCLGAVVVFASPVHMSLRADTAPIARVSATPLAAGPAISLMRAGSGSDEDCVQVARVMEPAGPYGALYAPRRLSCGE